MIASHVLTVHLAQPLSFLNICKICRWAGLSDFPCLVLSARALVFGVAATDDANIHHRKKGWRLCGIVSSLLAVREWHDAACPSKQSTVTGKWNLSCQVVNVVMTCAYSHVVLISCKLYAISDISFRCTSFSVQIFLLTVISYSKTLCILLWMDSTWRKSMTNKEAVWLQ